MLILNKADCLNNWLDGDLKVVYRRYEWFSLELDKSYLHINAADNFKDQGRLSRVQSIPLIPNYLICGEYYNPHVHKAKYYRTWSKHKY